MMENQKPSLKTYKSASLYGGTVDVKFDSGSHRYYINGRPASYSVSGITGILDKPALMYWAVKETVKMTGSLLRTGQVIDQVTLEGVLALAKGEHLRKKEEAADEGTEIHAQLENWLVGKIKHKPNGFKFSMQDVPELINLVLDKPEALRLSFQQFAAWLIEHGVVFYGAEQIIYSKKYGYPGQADVLMSANGKMGVGDYKFRSGVYEETRLQTAAYQGALIEESKIKYQKRWVFLFERKDGVWTGGFQAIEYKDFAEDFSAFLHALKLKKWLLDQRKK